MDKVIKRLFAEFRRLEERVKHLEGLLPSDSVSAPGRALVKSSESNHQGEAWAGANPSQAQASP